MQTEINKLERTIVALDFASLKQTKDFLESFDWSSEFRPYYLKLGMQLYYAEGAKVMDYLEKLPVNIFLDLKLHDIPNTVNKALTSILKNYRVSMINVHASGGLKMLQAAKLALDEAKTDTKLIAVTLLTSLSQADLNQDLGIQDSVEDTVIKLAQKAYVSKLDGVVCSAQEAKLIKSKTASHFLTVCPGIRFAGDNAHDQERVMTPQAAFDNAADFIVVGRALTQAENPEQLIKQLL